MYVIYFHKEIQLIFFLVLLMFSYLIYKRKKRPYKFWIIGLFVFYILIVINIVLFPIYIYSKEMLNKLHSELGQYLTYIQIVPFKTISNTFKTSGWKIQVIGNILLLFPFPVLLGVIKGCKFSVKKTFFLGFIFSLSIELSQLLLSIITGFPSRIADIDDLMLNTFGILLGILTYLLIQKIKLLNNVLEKFIKNSN